MSFEIPLTLIFTILFLQENLNQFHEQLFISSKVLDAILFYGIHMRHYAKWVSI